MKYPQYIFDRLSDKEVSAKYMIYDKEGSIWFGHAESEQDAYRIFLFESNLIVKQHTNRDSTMVKLWKV